MPRGEHLERLYALHPFAGDPSTPEGLKRYRDAVSELRALAGHRWFKELLRKRKDLRVVDLCSGAGIGGVALSRVLMDAGARVRLTLVDIRRGALEKAVEFGARELGFEPEAVVRDVLEIGEPGLEGAFDVALIWGLTTPHFSPWEWVRVLSRVSRILVDDGLFSYDEADRAYTVFYLQGYKELLPESVEKDRVVISVHRGKDPRSGYFNRLVMDLVSGEREEMDVYFWDLASSAAFTWVFFSDVDYLMTRGPYRGIVLARGPRRRVDLEVSYDGAPTLMER